MAHPEKGAEKRRNYRIEHYGYDPGEDPLNYSKDPFRHARALGYRSGLEVALCRGLEQAGAKFHYEPFRIPYVPQKTRFYKPDIVLPNGIILEAKGLFQTQDRTKHLAVRESNPDLEIRFVFSDPNKKIGKKSKTTYADWCNSKGFKHCKASEFPRTWLTEPINTKSLAAIEVLWEQDKKKK